MGKTLREDEPVPAALPGPRSTTLSIRQDRQDRRSASIGRGGMLQYAVQSLLSMTER
jgi:hypothetical protein